MIRRAGFELRYFLHRAPWDTGISPPELLAFLDTHPPGRALDLGCGTGTNAVTLARRGWRVTGVDFSSQAIRAAQARVRGADLEVEFRNGDVTRIDNLEGPFDLVLDIGCFHRLSPEDQDRYIANLKGWLASGGTFLLYAFVADGPDGSGFPGVDQMVARFSEVGNLRAVAVGKDRQRTSAWFTFENQA